MPRKLENLAVDAVLDEALSQSGVQKFFIDWGFNETAADADIEKLERILAFPHLLDLSPREQRLVRAYGLRDLTTNKRLARLACGGDNEPQLVIVRYTTETLVKKLQTSPAIPPSIGALLERNKGSYIKSLGGHTKLSPIALACAFLISPLGGIANPTNPAIAERLYPDLPYARVSGNMSSNISALKRYTPSGVILRTDTDTGIHRWERV